MFSIFKNNTLSFNLTVLGLSALILLMVACQPEEVALEEQDDTELVDLDAQIMGAYEEVDAISFEVMETEDQGQYARTFESADDMMVYGSNCPTITRDTATKTVTIDFGTGCLGADGRTRSGQIIINYTQRLYVPGATRTVSLQDYVVDSVQLFGTRTYTNLSTSFRDTLSLNTTLTGGKIILVDGTTLTREASFTRTWVRGTNPAQDVFIMTGSATGTRFNGVTYTNTIVEPLIFRRPCLRAGNNVPSKGVITIERSGKQTLEVDFGTGTCDRFVTISDGTNSRTIRIKRWGHN